MLQCTPIFGVPRTYRAYERILVEDSSCPSALRKLEVAMRVADVGAAVLALALHEYVVVRHEALRVARPMPGVGSLLCFVSDLHRLEELDETARGLAQALRQGELRVARPMPGSWM